MPYPMHLETLVSSCQMKANCRPKIRRNQQFRYRSQSSLHIYKDMYDLASKTETSLHISYKRNTVA